MVPPTNVQTHIMAICLILLNEVIFTYTREVYPSCLENPDIGINQPPGNHDECIFLCPREDRPVCDSAHHTHKNECTLCRTACVRPDRKLAKQCDGPCPCLGDAALKEWADMRQKKKEEALTLAEAMWEKHSEGFPSPRQPVTQSKSRRRSEEL